VNALERLALKVDRPREAMGEAWFMGAERDMYAYLLERPLEELSEGELEESLREIASGNSCFGPMREWKVWLDYLAAHLVPICLRPRHGNLQEVLCTAVMAQYHSGFHDAPYPQFGEDLLATVGQCIMHPTKWDGQRPMLGRIEVPSAFRLPTGRSHAALGC
jgi:hypothetical protein